MDNQYVIEVQQVQKRFGDELAVADVSFNVQAGEIFGLLGPNGAGKTTLLKMMTTLLRQDSGTIRLNGYDTLTQARAVRQQFGLTGQTATIDQDLSARENLIIFGRLNGLTRNAAKARADELLRDFSLEHSAQRPLSTFSGGMRRRLDLAVSLISRPKILFLDEPTTGLDPRTRSEMWTAIRQLVRQGSTVVLTTQYLEEADQLADRIALLDHGRLKALGPVAALKQQVGGLKLQLALAQTQATQPAQRIMTQLTTQPVQVSDRTVSVQLAADDATRVTAQILERLQQAQIEIDRFALEPPSLDDVFLTMTVGKN
ncbi:ATP-binding cassette domain-containing protein [Lactobacillus pentosus]|jgi:ABC-2 type transport system ATP-binding protein|uniref:ABC transporter, ATP-binding protein n=1 Tax=Lactiplantibacillus pentosus IG1 TaxID=1042160 RepID=G0LZP3_LACPE|nr:ATP-binding cassette domain-containing protein [Lactiplantibacillus pentosus]CCC18152.1 ABC transporter, ATP-binding protein [Lactiplantibacillus pentosus IG1]BBM23343.1 ABC transporter, ATP-binding protein, daunorubicin resistance family A [Lactiplantibacillus plantarum]MCT3284585.1 ATP-binding cassette domain-containing protein [Lactiplantibacillus pentosus]MCT3291734.1 ATP-binding cassette domain-containing protein [Lactiplantibacillus pentosus]MCT3303458.1 ATP-binding cassette domain-co